MNPQSAEAHTLSIINNAPQVYLYQLDEVVLKMADAYD